MYFFLGICQSMIGDRVIIDDSIPQIKFDRLLVNFENAATSG